MRKHRHHFKVSRIASSDNYLFSKKIYYYYKEEVHQARIKLIKEIVCNPWENLNINPEDITEETLEKLLTEDLWQD